ncbi:hypothetical protein ACP4OV_002725 [Aristida adscensionis]
MGTSIQLALAAVAVAVVASAGVRPARADLAKIESTCKAARAVERYFSPVFCRQRLSRHPGAADADVPELARIAAALGAGNADAARAEVARLAGSSGDEGYRWALERCGRLFSAVRLAFAAAEEAIVGRRYAAVREKLADASMLGHGCGGDFAGAGYPSPVTNYSVHNTQFVNMCIGITGLINIR